MSDEESRRLISELIKAVQENDKEKIDQLKYDNLWYGSNIFSLVPNYIFLTEAGIDFEFGFKIIKKGTKLFRVRKFLEGVNFNDNCQWSFPPSMPENRANHSKEAALYLGTTENVCILETHISKGEKYVVGEYEAINDIVLGGFIDCEDYGKKTRYDAGVVLNACLIAPARCDKNEELFSFLDDLYSGISINDLKVSDIEKLDLPLKFGFINKRNEFYKLTNRLITKIKEKYKDGLFYSSCYIPLSTVGITCSDSNIVLYKSGMEKIKFIKSEIKINTLKPTGLDFIKLLVKFPDGKKENKI